MKNRYLVLLAGLIFLAGCGGGNSSSNNGPTPTSASLNPGVTQQIDQGQSVNFNAIVAPATADQAVTWSLGGPGALSNQSPNYVTYTAPSSGAAGSATVTATVTNDTSITASVTVEFQPLPSFSTPSSLPPAIEGAAYNQTLVVTGGTGTITFSLAGGTSLPAGLTMDSSGQIIGQPTGPAGTTTFTVAASDSSMAGTQTATRDFSITVNLPSAPVISPATLPNGNVGTPYNQTLSVTGGLGPNYHWSVSAGTLPSGLALTGSNSTATISGIPVVTQSNVTFTIQVTDSSTPPQAATETYTISIGGTLTFAITTTSLPAATLNTAYQATISAQGGTGPYTFSLDPGSSPLPPGLSFSSVNSQGVISGTPTAGGQYPDIIVDAKDSAPTPNTAKATYTLTVSTKTLTILPASLPPATEGVSYSQTITASGGVSPYTFSLDSSSNPLPSGITFTAGSSQATISGTATVTGTFSGILVDVHDSQSPAEVAQISYTLVVYAPTTACGSGNESVLDGQYAFLLQGFDAQGPVGLAGSFTADGTGKITAGVEDMNRATGISSDLALTTASSSYSVGSDDRGCLTIATSNGTQTFRFALGSASSGVATRGHLVEFDTSGTNAVGVLAKQDPTAFSTSKISGNYAFGASAALAGGGRAGVAGQFTASSGSVTSGAMDLNTQGSHQVLTGVAGNYSVASNGRGSLTLTSLATPLNASLYVISSGKMFFLSSDKQTVNSPFAGVILAQTGMPYSVSSINGKAVFSAEGLGTAAGTSQVQVGLLQTDGAGNFKFSVDRNDGGSVGSTSNSGTYSVASGGRVTLNAATTQPVIYLVGQNRGFVVGALTPVLTGTLASQSIGPFSNASLSGTYFFGANSPVQSGATLTSGAITADGAGNLSGTVDEDNGGTLAGGQPFSTTYSVSTTGRTILGNNADILYVISPTKAVYIPISTGATNPTITFLDQ